MNKCTDLKIHKIPIFAPVSKDYYVEIEGKAADKTKCRFETEEETTQSYLVGNGAFIII